MSLRKHGTGEVLPEETGVQKSASQEDRDKVLADVIQEQQNADKESE